MEFQFQMKLGIHNIYRMREYCWKGFQGQRSKMEVIVKSNVLLRRRHTFRRC